MVITEQVQIWKLHLSDKMPLADDVTAESLAGRYDKVSGADIKDMVFYAALYTLEKEKECMYGKSKLYFSNIS